MLMSLNYCVLIELVVFIAIFLEYASRLIIVLIGLYKPSVRNYYYYYRNIFLLGLP